MQMVITQHGSRRVVHMRYRQRCYQDQGVRDQDQTKTRQAETETETKTKTKTSKKWS